MNDKHYNPAIAVRLRTLVDGRQWLAITSYLDSLSHAQFRTAGYMLGEKFMPNLSDDDFWTLGKVLVDYNRKAFLVTVLKSWVVMVSSAGTDHPLVGDYSQFFFLALQHHEEDQRKSMQVLLPVLTSVDDIEWLQQAMDITDARKRVALYLNTTTMATAFLLLQALHELEDDRPLLIRTTCFLMKRGDGFSFNLASLLCAFFGLEEVKGTFSLRIQPYELARLTSDFAAFRKALQT